MKRSLVEKLREGYRISERRACHLVDISRSSFRYISTRDGQAALRLRIKDIAATRVRYGYKRIHTLLRREGWKVNHKKVYRLYSQEGLSLRTKRPKRRVSAAHRRLREAAGRLNECWSADFVCDSLFDGKRFRALAILDDFSRKCLAILVDTSIRGKEVAEMLGFLKLVRVSTSLQNSPLSTVEFSPVCEQKNRVIQPSF